MLWISTELFFGVRLYDASYIKKYEKCTSAWNKYKHSQKSVAHWNNYGAYRSFMYVAEEKFVIPGLEDGFVPQGITFCESLNSFMLSGYSSRGGAAYIITVNASSGRINGEYEIRKSDGSVFCGHSGGIAAYGKNIYITDGYILYYISLREFTSSASSVTINGEILLPSSASFISAYDGYLWAGNFYHKSLGSKYDFRASDGCGNEYRTLIVGYRFDGTESCGIRTLKDYMTDTAEPYVAVYAPDEVQGIAFTDFGEIHLSCSYGRRIMSSQFLYKYPLKRDCDSYITLCRKRIPAWFLNNDRLIDVIYSYPMSEGAVSRNGRVYVIFESASEKYIETALDPTDCVWSIDWRKNFKYGIDK